MESDVVPDARPTICPGQRARLAIALAVVLLLAAFVAGLNPVAEPRGAHAQEGDTLTWTKLLDNKPHVIAFSPNFMEDRLALFGNSNKEREHGLWRSTDGGETWVKSGEGIPEQKEIDVYDIVFSPDFPRDQTVFASVNKQRVTLREPPGALFRSTDGGQTWEEIEVSGFPLRGTRIAQALLALTISPFFAEDRTLFAVEAVTGVYRSTDGGTTWEPVLGEKANVVRAVADADGQVSVVAATDSAGLFFSTDGGDTWETRNSGIEGVRNFKQVLSSANFAQDRTLLAMSTTGGIFITRDAGATWQNLARPPANVFMQGMASTPDFLNDRFLAYYTRDGEVLLSEDLGQTWQATDAVAILGGQIEAIFMPPDHVVSRTLYAISVFQGLFRHLPVEVGSDIALTATAVAVRATATAEAIPIALARQRAEREELRETGCITYMIPPFILLGIWLAKVHRRERIEKG